MAEEKRQRQRHVHHCPQSTRAQFASRQNWLPWTTTNQIRARALPARGLAAGIKASADLRKPFGLGFSSGEVMVR